MHKNISDKERLLSVLIGGAALAKAFQTRPSSTAVLRGSLGFGLLWRGFTGTCLLYKSLGIDAPGAPLALGQTKSTDKAVLVNKPIADVAELLNGGIRGLTLLQTSDPSVFQCMTEGQSWCLIITPTKDDRQTQLTAEARDYFPSNGKMRRASRQASGTGQSVSPAISDDLRKIKALIETGVTATIQGQSHGMRSAVGQIFAGFKSQLYSGEARTSDLELLAPLNHNHTNGRSNLNPMPTSEVQA